MPGPALVAEMYGRDYLDHLSDIYGEDAERVPEPTLRELKAYAPGTFLDYGCGRGELLERAAEAGWRTVGVEFDERLAKDVAARIVTTVITPTEALRDFSAAADVIHLGDVVEHLTDPLTQLSEILRLLKPGGALIAVGPLEGNRNLFWLGLGAWRRLRGSPQADMPPWHVTLATASGQLRLFARANLMPVKFVVDEAWWPAPARLDRAVLASPRALALHGLRGVSRAASRTMSHRRWGNRYVYVGTLIAVPVEI